MTEDLQKLATWLQEHRITVVAMESTGVYWKPVYNILELAGFEILVVNAQHIKAVPGRKTDVKDAEWIAALAAVGVGERQLHSQPGTTGTAGIAALPDQAGGGTRPRGASGCKRILEGANIKLSSVATNIVGSSGRSMD